jgi:hypothetical protein
MQPISDKNKELVKAIKTALDAGTYNPDNLAQLFNVSSQKVKYWRTKSGLGKKNKNTVYKKPEETQKNMVLISAQELATLNKIAAKYAVEHFYKY